MTTRGRCLLAGGLAAAICAILLDERDLLRVGILAAVLPLAAWLFTSLRRPRVVARHQIHPDRLSPGTTGEVVVTLASSGGGGPTLEFAAAPVADLTPGARLVLPGIRPGRPVQASYPLYASRRGRFVIGSPMLRIADPFGLWEDVHTIDSRAEVLVVPAPVTLTGLPVGAGHQSAASGRAVAGAVGGDPDVAVREYRSGDDIRTIHWRASARHDDLMVRLEEPVSHGGALVLLDHRAEAHRGTGRDSSLEVSITLAASISLHLLDSDHELALLGHAGQVIAHGHDISDDVLAGLALLEPTTDDAELQLPPVGTAGTVIAVLGAVDEALVLRLIATRPRGVQAVAILLDVESWNPFPGTRPGFEPGPVPGSQPGAQPGRQRAAIDVRRTESLLDAAGWRTAVLRRGDDLADTWRRACRLSSSNEWSGAAGAADLAGAGAASHSSAPFARVGTAGR